MKELCDPEDDEGFMPFMRKSFKIIDFSSLQFYVFQLSLRRCAAMNKKDVSRKVM